LVLSLFDAPGDCPGISDPAATGLEQEFSRLVQSRRSSVATAAALYAYAVTGSAFATLMALAAPHLDVFLRCLFHGKG
jgi:hypothetical protein